MANKMYRLKIAREGKNLNPKETKPLSSTCSRLCIPNHPRPFPRNKNQG